MQSSHYYSHTDLALEIREELDGENVTEGYSCETRSYCNSEIQESRIEIKSIQAARRFGKFPGTYITLEGVDLSKNDGDFHDNMSDCIAGNLRSLLGSARKVLVVGLGNRNITPDALGPFVIDNLLITRPAFTQRIPEMDKDKIRTALISTAIAPGVMAQTGMEVLEIIRGIIGQIMPEKVIVIDALAARRLERLNSTVQISSTGISPGSGVGNRRMELTEDSLGLPVIAIGVPTVISIPSVAADILTAVSRKMSDAGRQELKELIHFDPELDHQSEEHYRTLASMMDRRLFDFTMTPKEADEAVRRISFTISEGINRLVAGF